MSSLRRLALALCAAPLALGLAACGDADEGGLPSSEPIAKIAAPAGQQWVDAVAVTPEGGWLVGNPEAPIKLVEYGSLTCPACANCNDPYAAVALNPTGLRCLARNMSRPYYDQGYGGGIPDYYASDQSPRLTQLQTSS